jgi:hypothetical protein
MGLLPLVQCPTYLQTERKQMMQTTTLEGDSRMASKKFLPFVVSLKSVQAFRHMPGINTTA